VGVPLVAGWYPKERQGFAVGVYDIGNIGTAVAAFAGPAIAGAWGRPALGWVAGIVLAGTALLLWLLARDAPKKGPSPRYMEVLRSGWRLWRLSTSTS
jgi:NNP family nitrate/nitrite transporter-like MFS transporter